MSLWQPALCTDQRRDRMQVDGMLDPAAVDLRAARLHTPLPIEQHLTLTLETG